MQLFMHVFSHSRSILVVHHVHRQCFEQFYFCVENGDLLLRVRGHRLDFFLFCSLSWLHFFAPALESLSNPKCVKGEKVQGKTFWDSETRFMPQCLSFLAVTLRFLFLWSDKQGSIILIDVEKENAPTIKKTWQMLPIKLQLAHKPQGNALTAIRTLYRLAMLFQGFVPRFLHISNFSGQPVQLMRS